MTRRFITLASAFFLVLGFFVSTAGLQLMALAPEASLPATLAGLLTLVILGVVVAYPLSILLIIRYRSRYPVEGPVRRRYISGLARLHRQARLVSLDGLPSEPYPFMEQLYLRLNDNSNELLIREAKAVFFHTAISQSGRMDGPLMLRVQLRLVKRLARLYHPQAGWSVLPALYLHVLDAALTPNRADEIDYGAQIGPAIVGASVVGAIPGAGLVSNIIADAVIQGSANALMTLRMGLLTRRYFRRRLEGGSFDADAERRAVSEEALDMLAGLVSEASGTLSRTIWAAAKEHLIRIPGATLEGLKTAVTKSVRSMTRKARGNKAGTAAD